MVQTPDRATIQQGERVSGSTRQATGTRRTSLTSLTLDELGDQPDSFGRAFHEVAAGTGVLMTPYPYIEMGLRAIGKREAARRVEERMWHMTVGRAEKIGALTTGLIITAGMLGVNALSGLGNLLNILVH